MTTDRDDGWVFGISLDAEMHRFGGDAYATRELAIAAGTAEYQATGETFQTGLRRSSRATVPYPFDIESALDGDCNSDWDDDAVESFVDKVAPHRDAIQARLNKLWDEVVEEYDLYITLVDIVQIETHVTATPEQRAEIERRLFEGSDATTTILPPRSKDPS